MDNTNIFYGLQSSLGTTFNSDELYCFESINLL